MSEVNIVIAKVKTRLISSGAYSPPFEEKYISLCTDLEQIPDGTELVSGGLMSERLSKVTQLLKDIEHRAGDVLYGLEDASLPHSMRVRILKLKKCLEQIGQTS